MLPMFRPFTRYVQFQGRARRAEFWQFYLLYFIVAFAGMAIGLFLDFAMNGGPVSFGLVSVIWLLFIPPMAAVTVRRLHDCDRSGWWILLSFVPFGIFALLALFYTQEGTRGPNRFGPDQKTWIEPAGIVS